MNEIKGPQVTAKRHRIANFKGDAVGTGPPGSTGLKEPGQVHFPISTIDGMTLGPDHFSRPDETGREIDSDDLSGNAGKFECGPAHRTSQIEGPTDR